MVHWTILIIALLIGFLLGKIKTCGSCCMSDLVDIVTIIVLGSPFVAIAIWMVIG